MYRYYISRNWMVSGTARTVYRLSAWLSIALFFMLLAIPFLPHLSDSLAFAYRAALFCGVVGAGIVWVAMEYFLFGFDPSSAGKKSLWFLVCLFPMLGAAIYCLRVYSHSPVLDTRPSERPDGMVEEFRGLR